MTSTPSFRSPYHAFQQAAAQYPTHDFLHLPASTHQRYVPSGTSAASASASSTPLSAPTISYGDMLTAIDVQCERYRAAGYGPGCRVALMLENRPVFFVHFFALNALGASIVPLNGDYLAHEIQFVVDHSEAVLAVGIDATLPRLSDALANRIPVVNADGALPAAPLAPAAATAASADVSSHAAAPTAFTPSRSDECAILYTSGTTGKPKGCILDNEYFLSIGANYADEGGFCTLRPGLERLITPLPLFHMNALACSTMAMVLTGGCVIQLDRFHPRSWWRDVVESGATIMHYLGVMPAILLSLDTTGDPAAEVPEGLAPHAIRFGYGANVDPRHHHAFEARFGIPLIEGWAMTETGGGAVIASSHTPRHVGSRCFGKPRDTIELRLIDEHGNDVADGEPGQLVVRRAGPLPRLGFFRGYLKDPEATEAAWLGGWFRTGDVVRRDEGGSLHFVDRQKNIIRRSGENIAALEVEACLLEHPAVRQTAVIAAPDSLRDEEVMAFVIISAAAKGQGQGQDDALAGDDKAQYRTLAVALQQWCLERLAYYKAPGYIAFVESLPTTSTNKVQKTKLTAFGENPLAAPLCFDLRGSKKRSTPH